jgi:subtilisin family serine protease
MTPMRRNWIAAGARAMLVMVAMTPAVTQQAARGDDRIDPAVRAAIDSGQTVQVVVLGRRQLFAPVGGFDAFTQRNAGADRRVLRKQVVDSLKAIAAAEQPAILRALRRDRADRSLWILNAMVLQLSPAEVRTAAALDAVAFIYPSQGRIRPAAAARVAMPIQAPVERRPFTTDGKRIPWNIEMLGASRVWRELGITGEGVVIASLDAGVNYLHQDLRGNLWRNAREVPGNGRDDDGNGYVDDIYGFDFTAMSPNVMPRDTTQPAQHGTVTSGIALGDGTGGIITGVAPRAQLMVLRAGGVMNAALAYEYAVANGADIVSMSFSIPNLGNVRGLWRMMSDHAVAAGVVLVGGAGNFRISAQLPYQHQSPKDVPSVISVGGVDSAFRIVPFSSAGPAEWGTVALYGDYKLPAGIVKPEVVAFPGAGYPILSAARDSGYLDPNNRVRGNSFSGPQGAGVAALIFSAAPATPAWRVREIMEATARDLGPPGKDNDYGAGLIDAYAAVRAVSTPPRRIGATNFHTSSAATTSVVTGPISSSRIPVLVFPGQPCPTPVSFQCATGPTGVQASHTSNVAVWP